MYPNPQEALPLRPRPNCEQYRKLAKDLIKACRSGDATVIHAWAVRWIDRLATPERRLKTLKTADDVDAAAGRVDALQKEVIAAFSLACAYGRASVIEYFVAHSRVDVEAELKSHGEGHTGLHVAAFHGQLAPVRVLLKHGADVHAIDRTWNTPPLTWALTGWQRSGHRGQYHEVVAAILRFHAARKT